MKKFSDFIISCAHSMLLFVLAAFIGWVVMAKSNFMYGVWHDYAGIKEGIETYGPKNRFKTGFAETSREQRLAIFAAINHAIHHDGEGLAHIRYQTPTSQGLQQVLREPERVHLQDVANLIGVLTKVIWGVFFVWLAVFFWYAKSRSFHASLGSRFSGPILVLAGVGLVLLIFGAENVFNTLHIWIFPDEHQWFFYYQESLMSTMMLAPQLFAWIAGAWALISLAVFAGLTAALTAMLLWWDRSMPR